MSLLKRIIIAALHATRPAIKAALIMLLLIILYAVLMFFSAHPIAEKAYWGWIIFLLFIAVLFLNAIYNIADPRIKEQLERMIEAIDDRPVLVTAKERREAIKKHLPGKILIKANPLASGQEPWFELHAMNTVKENSQSIEKYARQYGIDPDLVRAVMYMEETHGYYDVIHPQPNTIRPMNVHAELWQGFGFDSRDQLFDTDTNIRVGSNILGEIWRLTDYPTIEKVATLYKNLSADNVSDYGARVNDIFNEKPWQRD